MENEVSPVGYEHQPNVQISDPCVLSRVSQPVLPFGF
jgi:hypothetical protein